MKKLFLSVSLFFFALVHAQQEFVYDSLPQPDNPVWEYQSKKNIVKLSLTSLIFNNFQLQYERIINKKVGVSLSLSTFLSSNIPQLNSLEVVVDDADTFLALKGISLGYYSITPEVRFYLGKQGFGKGFYLAPFYRHSNFIIEGAVFDFQKDDGSDTELSTKGNLNANTLGLLLGSQFNLSKNLVLDWWIVGPHLGVGSGGLEGSKATPFTNFEKESLQATLDSFELPLVESNTVVEGQKATIDFSGPWGGVRAGLSLGYRF